MKIRLVWYTLWRFGCRNRISVQSCKLHMDNNYCIYFRRLDLSTLTNTKTFGGLPMESVPERDAKSEGPNTSIMKKH